MATAVFIGAILPPVRQHVADGSWGLVHALGFHQESPTAPTNGYPPATSNLTNPGPAASPEAPRVLSPTVPAGVATSSSPIITTTPAPPENNNVTNPVAPTPDVLPQPEPIQRPAETPVSVRYHIDGSLHVGSIISVNVSALSRFDLVDATIAASLSPGATFVNVQNASRPNFIWHGNLPQGVPGSAQVLLSAAQPGLYDLRIAVRGGGETASSDLLMPIGLQPSLIAIDTSRTGPSDLYTAASTLAVESNHPVAVEDGLRGTLPVNIRAVSAQDALAALSAEFGCSAAEQDGVSYISLHAKPAARPAAENKQPDSRPLTQSAAQGSPDSMRPEASTHVNAAPAP